MFLTVIKDCLWPYFCKGCDVEGEWWCGNCRGPVAVFSFESELDRATAFFKYKDDSPVSTLIKEFKFQFTTDLEGLWREIVAEADLTIANDFEVVPVPLFKKRQRERGFNQAEILGRIVAERFNLKINCDGLVRVRATGQQAKLSKAERAENMREAFAWKSETGAPKKVILVDDVYTSGATMRECAAVLKERGAEVVEGLVLAHG